MGAHERIREVREQAAQWLVRFGDHDVSYADHLRYLEWLRTSPLHEAEMRAVLRLGCALTNGSAWLPERTGDELIATPPPAARH